MLVEEAIRARASIKVFSQEPVDPKLVERCLDAAVWAPNHHLTEPWHFTVVAGEMREWLGRLVKREMTQGASGLDVAIVAAKAFKEEKKLLSAPTILVVYSDAGSHERETRENYAASCAAAQNVLLMARQLGVAGIWRTSSIYELPKVREVLGAHDGALFVGALFLGYSAQREVKRRRTPAHQKTHWLSPEDFQWLETSEVESQSGI